MQEIGPEVEAFRNTEFAHVFVIVCMHLHVLRAALQVFSVCLLFYYGVPSS